MPVFGPLTLAEARSAYVRVPLHVLDDRLTARGDVEIVVEHHGGSRVMTFSEFKSALLLALDPL